MCITEEKLVDRYGESNPHERFMLIYKNYEVFLRLVESYETGLFNRILYEREYNLRAKNGEDKNLEIDTMYDNHAHWFERLEYLGRFSKDKRQMIVASGSRELDKASDDMMLA